MTKSKASPAMDQPDTPAGLLELLAGVRDRAAAVDGQLGALASSSIGTAEVPADFLSVAGSRQLFALQEAGLLRRLGTAVVGEYTERLRLATEAEHAHYQGKLKPSMDKRDALESEIRNLENAGATLIRGGRKPPAPDALEKLAKLKGDKASLAVMAGPLTAEWYRLRLVIQGAKAALQRANSFVRDGQAEVAAHELLNGRPTTATNAHSRSQKQETPIENDTRTKPN